LFGITKIEERAWAVQLLGRSSFSYILASTGIFKRYSALGLTTWAVFLGHGRWWLRPNSHRAQLGRGDSHYPRGWLVVQWTK